MVFPERRLVPQAEAAEEFIGGQFRVAALSFKQGSYLVAYLVALKRLNPVRLPKLRGKGNIPPTPAPDPLADLPDPRKLARGDGERWVVGRGHRENF